MEKSKLKIISVHNFWRTKPKNILENQTKELKFHVMKKLIDGWDCFSFTFLKSNHFPSIYNSSVFTSLIHSHKQKKSKSQSLLLPSTVESLPRKKKQCFYEARRLHFSPHWFTSRAQGNLQSSPNLFIRSNVPDL